MKLIPLLMIIAGTVLLYAAYADQDPRAVIFGAIGSKAKANSKIKTASTTPNAVPDTGLPSSPIGNGPFVSV